MSRQLHPAILDDLGLVDALRSECVQFQKRENITIRYATDNVPTNLPRDTALCLYRIAQEALRNVAPHAETSTAEVALTGYAGEVLPDDHRRGERLRLGLANACTQGWGSPAWRNALV